jgi:predicted transcriptional regulator of viral defense system
MNIKEYISQNGGYISSAEAKEKSLYNQLLYEVEKGTIVRVRQGIYALDEGLAKPMVDVERLVPGGVLCAYSAWSHYGLTTQIPLAYCIAIERSRKVTLPEYPPIELFFLSKSVFELGVSETVIEGFQVKIYDMEKSVCDAVKYRNRIGIDVSSEILRNYLSRKDSDITRLYAYANAMRLGKRMDELVKYMI